MQPKVSKTKKPQSRAKKEISFPLEKTNFMIIGLGLAVLVLGYFLMSQNSVDGFLPTVVAPIILLLGYCVIIPYGILKNKKSTVEAAGIPTENTGFDTVSSTGSVSANVKTK